MCMQVIIVVLVTRSSGQCNSGLRSSVQEYAHATRHSHHVLEYVVADGNNLYLRLAVQYYWRKLEDASEASRRI